MKKKEKRLSNCCKAKIIRSKPDSNGTQINLCSKCKRACWAIGEDYVCHCDVCDGRV